MSEETPTPPKAENPNDAWLMPRPDTQGVFGALTHIYTLLKDMRALMPEITRSEETYSQRLDRHEKWSREHSESLHIRGEAAADERLREQTASWLLAAITQRVRHGQTYTPQVQVTEAVMLTDMLRAELARTRAAEVAKQEAVLDGAKRAAAPARHPYTEYHDAAQRLAEDTALACMTIDGLGDENISATVQKALEAMAKVLTTRVNAFYDAGKRCVPVDDPEAP